MCAMCNKEHITQIKSRFRKCGFKQTDSNYNSPYRFEIQCTYILLHTGFQTWKLVASNFEIRIVRETTDFELKIIRRDPCHCHKPNNCHFKFSFRFRSIRKLSFFPFYYSTSTSFPIFRYVQDVISFSSWLFSRPELKYYKRFYLPLYVHESSAVYIKSERRQFSYLQPIFTIPCFYLWKLSGNERR